MDKEPHPLARLFTGGLADFTPPSGADGPPGALDFRQLADPASLDPAVRMFARKAGLDDLRGAATQWSKWTFGALLGPALVANFLCDQDLPVQPQEAAVSLAADGGAERLHLPRVLPAVAADPAVRFQRLLEDYLLPVIAALSTLSGLSPRVFGNNAGNGFEYLTGLLKARSDASPAAASAAETLMSQHRLSDGRFNPFFQPVYYLPAGDAGPRRFRRLCCVRFLASGLDYCSNCPLLDETRESTGRREVDNDSCSN